MYYVYILKLSNNTYYHGFSMNLRNRIKTHQNGNVSQTNNYRPLTLVFYCAFRTKNKALEFEKYLKTGSGSSFRNGHLV